MTERENILARVREALKVNAPIPGHDHDGKLERPMLPGMPEIRRLLPKVGESERELLETFAKTAAELKAEFRLVPSQQELQVQLAALRDSEGWKKIGCHSGELTRLATAGLKLPICTTDAGYDPNELEACDAGITECDALIAQTGSVLVTNRSAGGRALSVLPPHHVVLARVRQLVPDLPAAFGLLKQKYAPNYPSFISFITGPSRTGDIERILVLGAHGPKKLTIFCLQWPDLGVGSRKAASYVAR